jgi:hypothetical protein
VRPGDLLQPRRFNVSHRVPITYLDIWDRPDGSEVSQRKWEHGDVGVLLEGRYTVEDGAWEDMVMVEVLIHGGRWWVLEDEVEVISG